MANRYVFLAIAALAVLAGCTKKPEEATVKFVFPNVSTSGARKVQPLTAAQQSVSILSSPTWGFGSMASIADVNCFGVFVRTPEKAAPNVTCKNTDGADVVSLDIWRTGFNPGEAASVLVPSGQGRQFYLIGIKANSPMDCSMMANGSLDHSKYSKPMVLGSTVADIAPGENELTINGTFNLSKEFDDCPNMGSINQPPPPAFTVTDTCAPEVANNTSVYSCTLGLSTADASAQYTLSPNHNCGGTLAGTGTAAFSKSYLGINTPGSCLFSVDVVSQGKTVRLEHPITNFEPTSVGPRYSVSPNWNDYSDAISPNTACIPGTATRLTDCFHAGERREALVFSIGGNCAGVMAKDDLDAFNWTCDTSMAPARMVSTLKAPRGLRHLLLPTGTGFRPNFVRVFQNGTLIAKSAPQVWWSNQVALLSNNSAALTPTALDSTVGKIFVAVGAMATAGYHFGADKQAVVTLDGASLGYNRSGGAPDCSLTLGFASPASECLLAGAANHFLWVEGAFNAPSPVMANVFLYGSKFSQIKLSAAQGATHGYLISNSRFIRMAGVIANNNQGIGVRLYDTAYSLLEMATANGNGSTGIVDAWSSPTVASNVILNSTANGSGTSGTHQGVVIQNANTDLLMGVTATKNFGKGILIQTSDGTVLQNTLTALNQYGVYIGGSAGTVFGATAISKNTMGGLEAPSVGDAIFTGPFVVGFNASNTPSVNCNTPSDSLFSLCASDSATTNGGITRINRDIVAGNSFVGFTRDAIAAPGDLTGTLPFASITNWLSFESLFRWWAPTSGASGLCNSLSCRVFDVRLRVTDTVLRYNSSTGAAPEPFPASSLAACPSRLSGNQSFMYDSKQVLKYAYEFNFDAIGNNDGLCESGEACIDMPNFGGYPGEMAPTLSSCVFQDGTVASVKMIGLPNGVP